ncbi:amino acid-binding protein [Anaerosphaera multitolerans]|uniref:Amino acid-binding protein n=1 Tax=Anaerosphaera multitolerans TaxID=2487351 RepID=A0A437S5B7_9FIRM|nr:amino acid-binding protein [Anaerosphaera multitolerans]RVU54225.1 amino acid-binding protein [Anaerosphaera multitolerans]
MLKQLSVFIENEGGSASEVTETLSRNNINIRAVSLFDSPEFCILRLIVDDTQKGADALRKENFLVKETDVIGISLNDEIGELNRMLKAIAADNIVVNYLYSLVVREDGRPLMVINVDDIELTKNILIKAGFDVV